MTLHKGMKLKRKFYDFKNVTIISIENDYVQIQDSNGRHFVPLNLVEQYFIKIEEDFPLKVNTHINIDDPLKHNISGSLNRPSRDQLASIEKK